MKKIFWHLNLFLLLSLSLTGCIDAMFSGGRLAKLEGERQIWQQLAFARDAEAQYKLGTLYCCGERPYYDNVRALYWWCQAGKAGQRDALYEIGRVYESANSYKGSIIPKNDVLAYTYYTLAEEGGNTQAKSSKQSLEKELSLDELRLAEKYAAKWPAIACEVER